MNARERGSFLNRVYGDWMDIFLTGLDMLAES